MQRTRQVAASPQRSASATWKVITDLVADTVDRSAVLPRADVEAAMAAAASVGRMLVAGGHLDHHPVTLIAGSVHCAITTVSGAAALTLEENLNPVPGAAQAETYSIHLPAPDPLRALVEETAKNHNSLSAAPPPMPVSQKSETAVLIDAAALRKAVHGG